MRKFTIVMLVAAMLLCSAVTVFAWTESDIVTDGDNEIIVPLQVPELNVESAFSIDETVADHNGEYGTVYRGKVDVSSEQKRNKLFSFNNLYFNEGRYKVSMWFMEDPDNSDILTRMIRPLSNYNDTGTTLRGDNGAYLLFFNSAGEKIIENGETVGVTYRADKEIRGVWKKYEMEFTVSSSSNASWIGKPNAAFSWECVGKYEDEGKKYTDKFINGDIYILFSDVKIFKYPSEDFGYISDNGGDTASEFRVDFSAPVSLDKIESVKINGVEKPIEALDVKSENNSLLITPKGGFAPGKEYTVSLSGVYDIFDRKYDGEISGSITVPDYLTVEYQGSSGNENTFGITNNMNKDANLLIAVFYYSGNSVKKVSYSLAGTVEAGGTSTVSVPAAEGCDGLSAKAQIWDTSMLPMPLSTEIALY